MIRAFPFCGAEAKVCKSRKKNDLQVYVRCNSCGAQTKRRRAKEIRDADEDRKSTRLNSSHMA